MAEREMTDEQLSEEFVRAVRELEGVAEEAYKRFKRTNIRMFAWSASILLCMCGIITALDDELMDELAAASAIVATKAIAKGYE